MDSKQSMMKNLKLGQEMKEMKESYKTSLLLVIDSLRAGGAERQMVELIKGLDKNKFNIHLYCLSKQENSYEDLVDKLGITINYYTRKYKYDLIRPVFEIKDYIHQNRIDVVQTFLNLGSLIGVAASRLAGKKVICSAIREGKDSDWKLMISKKVLAVFSDVYVSNSWAGFNNRFKKIKPNFKVIYNGIDFSRFEKQIDVESLKDDLALTGKRHVIGMIASLSPYKDHITLLNAAKIVISKHPDACFLVVGDGAQRESLELLANSNGIEDHVIFAGYRSDVDQIYKVLDIFVLLTNTDLHQEGISNAILEAMVVGVPVIATAGGGTDELIDHNENGIIIAPKSINEAAEAILNLLENKSFSEQLSKNAQEKVFTNFGLDRYVEEYT